MKLSPLFLVVWISFNTFGQDRSMSNSTENLKIVGSWKSDNERLEFLKNGIVIIQGVSTTYSLAGNKLVIHGPGGAQTFTCSVVGDYLTINIDGQSERYKKINTSGDSTDIGNSTVQTPYNSKTIPQEKGVIAQELVGKWCYVNLDSSNPEKQNTDECIVINNDGTYTYNFSSGGNASGDQYGNQTFTGETGSQASDRGTWRLNGNTLYVQSQAKGPLTFTLQKMNNPKNGDPMIVIDGRAYITYYQRPGW